MTSKIEILSKIQPDDIYPFIDTGLLFSKQWQFGRSISKEESFKILEEWKTRCKKDGLLHAKVAIGYFAPTELAALTCSHLVGESRGDGKIPLMIATVGEHVVREKERLFTAHKYSEAFYLNGFAGATAEALTEYAHRYVLKQLGREIPSKLPFGSRISPGYRSWPNLEDQKTICNLLHAEKIGVRVTEAYQLVPEYTTSSMIILTQTKVCYSNNGGNHAGI